MKIVHTADVHLDKFEGERWLAFQQILELGKKEKVDVAVISGDLFDKNLNAVKLRLKIEQSFSNCDFPILLLPGNHDFKAYQNDPYWGKNVRIIKDFTQPVEINQVLFWGLPFEDLSERQIVNRLEAINDQIVENKPNIFVYHGELVESFFAGQSSGNFGDEGEKRYLPVKLSYFKQLKFDYVLAGHFHSKFDLRGLGENRFFVYPGSPVSITKKEVGQRQVNLFEVGQVPKPVDLNTPYFAQVDYRLDPFTDQAPIAEIKTEIDQLPPEAKILISVHGFFDQKKLGMTKKELIDQLNQLAEKHGYQQQLEKCLVRNVSQILTDELFKQFMSQLDQLETNNPQKIQQLVIEAIMEAKAK